MPPGDSIRPDMLCDFYIWEKITFLTANKARKKYAKIWNVKGHENF